jgi:nucleoid-associated protein YgaU
MARETKVGLLIGLGMILLIGIIISDQLAVTMDQREGAQPIARGGPDQSGARGEARFEEAVPTPHELADASGHASGGGQPLAALDDSQPASGGSRTRPDQRYTTTEPTSRSDVAPVTQPTYAPAISGGTGDRRPAGDRGESAESDAPADSTLASRQSNGTDQPPRETEQRGSLAASTNNRAGTPQSRQRGTSAGQTQARAEIDPAPDQSSHQPGQLIHQVERGQNLYSIAKKYYGQGTRWRVIRQANADKIGADGRVEAGMELAIPNRGASASGEDNTANNVSRMEQVRQAAETYTLTVRKKDTLSALAREYLGDGSRWREFIEHNADKLDDPGDLRPGMTLALPPLNASSASSAESSTEIRTAADRSSPRERRRSQPVDRTYTVQSGDTLYTIAKQRLGNGSRWKALYNANKDKLDSPDDLTVGMTLQLPSDAI